MSSGRNVKTPKIARFGARNSHGIGPRPNVRCTAWNGASTTRNAATTGAAARCFQFGVVTWDASRAGAPPLLRGLDLLVHVLRKALQRVVGAHLARDGLAETLRRGLEHRAIKAIALQLVVRRRDLADVADEHRERRFHVRRRVV